MLLATGRLRKALHSTLQPEAARNFRPIQEKAARTVITDILSEPEKFQSHVQTYAATVGPCSCFVRSPVLALDTDVYCLHNKIVVNLGYGRQDKARYSDPDIQKIIVGAERLGAVLRPGAWKIDSFPWLKCKRKCLSELSGSKRNRLSIRASLYRRSWIPQSTQGMGSGGTCTVSQRTGEC